MSQLLILSGLHKSNHPQIIFFQLKLNGVAKAVAVFTPKEANSKDISQFRSIALLNIEGKIFFSVLARRMTTYLLENDYIDTNCQKAGVPGFPGCTEHSALIWDQIQKAKREKTDLHIIWLDLANAYGLVPQSAGQLRHGVLPHALLHKEEGCILL